MYLKALELDGFKSFSNKTILDFTRGITAVVGPNGSGKSNILDAILWVLGEQSYKSIRAAQSSDIIFSGGKNKRASNFAEVSLVVENSDRYLDYEHVIKVTLCSDHFKKSVYVHISELMRNYDKTLSDMTDELKMYVM